MPPVFRNIHQVRRCLSGAACKILNASFPNGIHSVADLGEGPGGPAPPPPPILSKKRRND